MSKAATAIRDESNIFPTRLTVKGKLRIIRDVKENEENSFWAYYRGCSIQISPMYKDDPRARKRWSFDVCGRDGCYIVNTWEYADEKTREQLLIEALENILHNEK